MDFVAIATHSVRRAMIGQVRAVLNDAARGEAPVERSANGLFSPESVVWRVHGDVTTMLIGGVAGLLLQMLHPEVLAGVWDHSRFRQDMLGRLRRTARFIALTSYAERDAAEAAIAHVRGVHARIAGVLPDGTPYRADDPRLLAWVHVTEAVSFLDGWIRYAEPGMSRGDQDRYFAEFAQVAVALGADPVPRSRAEALALIAAMRSELRVDDRTRAVARLLLEQPAPNLATKPFQAITFAAAIDLLPAWARRMHGLASPPLAAPALRLGTRGMAETLRWAFR